MSGPPRCIYDVFNPYYIELDEFSVALTRALSGEIRNHVDATCVIYTREFNNALATNTAADAAAAAANAAAAAAAVGVAATAAIRVVAADVAAVAPAVAAVSVATAIAAAVAAVAAVDLNAVNTVVTAITTEVARVALVTPTDAVAAATRTAVGAAVGAAAAVDAAVARVVHVTDAAVATVVNTADATVAAAATAAPARPPLPPPVPLIPLILANIPLMRQEYINSIPRQLRDSALEVCNQIISRCNDVINQVDKAPHAIVLEVLDSALNNIIYNRNIPNSFTSNISNIMSDADVHPMTTPMERQLADLKQTWLAAVTKLNNCNNAKKLLERLKFTLNTPC